MAKYNKDKVLRKISGEKGIVSLIGSKGAESGVIGDRVDNDFKEEAVFLNCIAKIFHIAGDYCAVAVSCNNNDVVALSFHSFVGEKLRQNLRSQNSVDSLLKAWKNYVLGKDNSIKELFIEMYKYGAYEACNALDALYKTNARDITLKDSLDEVMKILTIMSGKNPAKGGADGKFAKSVNELDRLFSNTNLYDGTTRVNDKLMQIARDVINFYLPGGSLYQMLCTKIRLLKDVNIVPLDNDDIEDDLLHVHVEQNAVYYLRKQNAEPLYAVGLSTKKPNHVPGCCAICTAEFNALEEIEGLRVYRTTDYPDNFPPNFAKPSPNVTNNQEVFDNFVDQIYESMRMQVETTYKNNMPINNAFDEFTDLIGGAGLVTPVT